MGYISTYITINLYFMCKDGKYKISDFSTSREKSYVHRDLLSELKTSRKTTKRGIRNTTR
jgi:hypothetical protein